MLAKDRRVIPVTRRLLADGETPVGVYRKLAAERPGTFLLESAEHGGVWSRYSFVGARCAATLTERDGTARLARDAPVGLPSGGDPLAAVRDTFTALATPRLPDLPPLTGGLVGFIGYDAVRRLRAAARPHRGRPAPPRAGADARDRPRGAGPRRRQRAARRERGELGRHRRARRRCVGGRCRPTRADDHRARPASAVDHLHVRPGRGAELRRAYRTAGLYRRGGAGAGGDPCR